MGTAMETRTYKRQESVVFFKTAEAFGGLSNMAPGFPLRVNGIDILTSEALYQACRFPHLADVQRLIIDQKSPMTAKMKSKPYRSRSREDWDAVRVRVMRWCLRVKLAQNWSKFRDLLLATGDRPIVEESKKDEFWAAKARDEETLAGANVLGRLLMELRQDLRGAASESLRRVEPPGIRDFRLFDEPILGLEPEDVRAMNAGDLFATSSVEPPKKQEGDGEIAAPTAGSGSMAPLTGASSTRPGGVSANPHPRRLIEVDLPIKAISTHARREKSIRHGHISTLHIWWARRPLAACRAVILAALWPDPADPLCPDRFRVEAAGVMKEWRNLRGGAQRDWNDPVAVRAALLDFIAEFANWDNSTSTAHLETARRLVQVAHESLGGAPGTRPLVVDPFAGGGAIPLEALRVGADAFASDLNPVAVLLNKVVLEYIPKHGQDLVDEVRKWGQWVKTQLEAEMACYYPPGPDTSAPIAFIWARTILSEAPGEGDIPIEVPLFRSMWLSNKPSRRWALRWVRDQGGQVKCGVLTITDAAGIQKRIRRPQLEVFQPRFTAEVEQGTSKGGAATCPVSGYTTSVERVREQLMHRRGGSADARMICVVATATGSTGRLYRNPTEQDACGFEEAARALARRATERPDGLAALPDEKLNHLRGFFNVVLYGMSTWGSLFAPRQALALSHLVELVRKVGEACGESELAKAVQTCLALALDRCADKCASVVVWNVPGEKVEHVFGRQALPMVWDFAEANILASVGWTGACEWVTKVLDHNVRCKLTPGTTALASATAHPLPDDTVDAVVTDPPYYAAIPYADLSDFFYSWLKRSVGTVHPELFSGSATPKDDECVQLSHRAAMYRNKDASWFEAMMSKACAEARRVAKPGGIGVFVFANKETAGWEAMLAALVSSGWVITASWPIDTEMSTRLRARNSAVLASSVHLVCRPRENADGSVQADSVGDWRAALSELPSRIRAWLPRLAKEGVVGADAIFACLGPALEIFSRHSRVEKASGERVELREYLEQVWAAVAREALSMIFEDADATGLEEDARLTAMWLWTLSTSVNGGGNGGSSAARDGEEGAESEDHEEGGTGKAKPSAGYSLEFDAARKIAQGLGAHLEALGRVIEIKGDQARLLSVAERTRHLFGKDQAKPPPARRAKKVQQFTLFEELDAAEKDAGWGDVGLPPLGETTLDRVHQAMVLFAAGRGEALKRFLVEEGAGRAATFWKLAQSLSALYPSGTDEKRWVDGVLARKKGLGFG